MPCQHQQWNTKPVTFKDGTVHMEKRCGACNQHLGYAPKHENNMPKMLYFGKFQGRSFDWVAQNERDYFNWFLQQPDIKRKLRIQIEAALKRNPVKKPEPPTPEMIEAREAHREGIKNLFS